MAVVEIVRVVSISVVIEVSAAVFVTVTLLLMRGGIEVEVIVLYN